MREAERDALSILLCLILLSLKSYSLEIEGEFYIGDGSNQVTVIGTSIFPNPIGLRGLC